MRQGILAGLLAVLLSVAAARSGSAVMLQSPASSDLHRFIVIGCIKPAQGQGTIKMPDLTITDFRGGPVASFLLDGKDAKLIPWVNDTVELTGTVPPTPGAAPAAPPAAAAAPEGAAPAGRGGRGGGGGGRGGGRGAAAAPAAPPAPIPNKPMLLTVENVRVISRGCTLKLETN